MQRKATGPDYRTDGVTLSARGPLICRVFGDYLANLRVMAMKTLASELGEIDGMKDVAQINSPWTRGSFAPRRLQLRLVLLQY